MNGYDFGLCIFGSKAKERELSFRGAGPSWEQEIPGPTWTSGVSVLDLRRGRWVSGTAKPFCKVGFGAGCRVRYMLDPQ